MRARVRAVAAMGVAALLLAGCAAASPASPARTPEAAEQPDEQPSAPEATVAPPELTVDDIIAWAGEAEWSFAPDGLGEPFTVQLRGGTATDDLSRTYELGTAVEADVDGDGVVDAAISLTQLDGNAVHELWYVWRGLGIDSDPVAEQVIYPIARTTRCGDVTSAVSPVEAGLQVDVTLRMPHTDDARSCADGGTGTLTRVIHLEEIDGTYYPVQTEPVAAWGGVCPPSQWLDGIEDIGIAGRAAPPASAPVVTDPDRSIGLYELPEAPLLTAEGARFFGFVQDYASEAAVKMHCAFAG